MSEPEKSDPFNVGRQVAYAGRVWSIVSINYLGDYDLVCFYARDGELIRSESTCALGLSKDHPHYAELLALDADLQSQLSALTAERDKLRKNLDTLIQGWRYQAADSHSEADRIRRTIGMPTDAEQRCKVRADIWCQCADELERRSTPDAKGA